MSADVYNRVDKELERRLDLKNRYPPGHRGAAKEKADYLHVSPQTWNNWRTRSTGIPPKEYGRIAQALHWTIDQVVGKVPADRAKVVPMPRGEPLLTPFRRARLKRLLERLRAIPGGEDGFFRDWDLLVAYFERQAVLQEKMHRPPASKRPAK